MKPLNEAARFEALREAQAELDILSRKENPTKHERRREAALLSRTASLRAGVSLAVAMAGELQEGDNFSQEFLSSTPKFASLSPQRRAESDLIRHWAFTGQVDEKRAETVGSPVYVNLNGNNGSLVPVEFFNRLIAGMAQHSPLMDEANVTWIATNNGRPIQVPFISDIENVAEVITEGSADDSSTDIASVGGVHIQTYSYRTPRIELSYESAEDVANFSDMLEYVLGDRLARGAGIDLMTGNGSGKPLGLIPSIVALNAIVTASGNATNDGSGDTGSNSIGSQDLTQLFFSVPAPYRTSPKFAFVMNSTTALFISKQLDKMGHPLIDMTKALTLFGKPVLIDESMDNIGASKVPVICGDLSYWVTRIGIGTLYLQRYFESAGLAEAGKYAIRCFGRVGGALTFNDTSAPSPIWALRNHS